MVTGLISSLGAFTQSRTWLKGPFGKGKQELNDLSTFSQCHMLGLARRTLQSHSNIIFPRFLESYFKMFRFSVIFQRLFTNHTEIG